MNILPQPIAHQLKQGQQNIADGFPEVTILLADLVGFTQLSSRKNPKELVALLNAIFSAFDRLTDRHGLEKIKTIGDAYRVAGGLPDPESHSAAAIAQMAIEMQQEMQNFENALEKTCNCELALIPVRWWQVSSARKNLSTICEVMPSTLPVGWNLKAFPVAFKLANSLINI